MSHKRPHPLVEKCFFNSDGWHFVEAEVSTGCFLIRSTTRKGLHETRKIWRTLEVAPYRLFLSEAEMHEAELTGVKS
jgi:hypothetical protein